MAAGQSRWLLLTAAVIAADRATKYAVERGTTDGFRSQIIPHVAWLVHSTNPGMAFGMFASGASKWVTVGLVLTASAVVALLVWLLITGRAGAGPTQAALALIAGGAAGNLLDRVARGGVTDFLEIHIGRFEWPAFNLADSAITIGALLIFFEFLRGNKQQPAKEHA